MSNITAQLVKELREASGAGMMDCKNALVKTNGNFEEAIDWLRTKGLATAAKKAGRVAAEGLVGAAINGKLGAVVEINSETDFVARNEKFQEFVRAAASLATTVPSIDALKTTAYPGASHSVEQELTNLVATIGENMTMRRLQVVNVEDGVVTAYMHNAIGENIGKIGVLVALESKGDEQALKTLGKQIAMHIAATNPIALESKDIPQEAIDRERAIFTEQAIASGKSPEIAEKMVDGRIRKYYEEVALLEQTFVLDGENKIRAVLEKASKDLGTPVKINAFARFMLGEGIEKESSDFAAEVAAAAKG